MKNSQLRVGHLSTAYHTNYILMANNSLEKSLNREVIWKLYGTGPLMVKAFLENKLDVGYMGLPPAIIGISQGAPIKCVAGGHVEGTIMIARKKYKTIMDFNDNFNQFFKQFKNKSIGVPSKGSIHDVILNALIGEFYKEIEINVHNYEQAEFIAIDLKNNKIQAGVGTPSLAIFTTTLVKSKIIVPPNYFWTDNPSYGVFFHESLIQENPELVLEFLKYHKNASYLLRENPSKASEIISKTFNILNKDYVESILKISPKYCIALSEGYVNATVQFIKILHNQGYISKLLGIDDVFNFKFIQEIHPETSHY